MAHGVTFSCILLGRGSEYKIGSGSDGIWIGTIILAWLGCTWNGKYMENK